MKRFVTMLLWVAVPVFAAEPVQNAFGPGEQTSYQVTWMGVPTGRAQVTVGWKTEQFGQPVWPILCSGETSSLAAAFPVRDRFISYFNPTTQTAVGADFFVSEGNWKKRERYRYDATAQKAYVTRHVNGKEPYDRDYDIAPNTMDLASAAFRLRNTPMSIGAVIETPVFTGYKTYQMRVSVEGRETIETQLGSMEVFRTTVTTDFNGNMKTDGAITMYFTADAKQLPVRARAEFALGHVDLDVTRYEPGRTGGTL